MAKFVNKIFRRFDKFFDKFLDLQSLLTIASFRIGVPSIVFFFLKTESPISLCGPERDRDVLSAKLYCQGWQKCSRGPQQAGACLQRPLMITKNLLHNFQTFQGVRTMSQTIGLSSILPFFATLKSKSLNT